MSDHDALDKVITMPGMRNVIEIEGAAGPRVRVRLNGPTLAEVAAFARLVVGATS